MRRPGRLHVVAPTGEVVLSNVLEDGSLGPFPSPAEALAKLAAADDPQTCALLRECARQVFQEGPLNMLAEWGDHLLCTAPGKVEQEGEGEGEGGSGTASVDVSKLKTLHLTNKRGVCHYTFRQGDVAWNCRVCQADPTCVQCDSCFRHSNHAGHEVYFHHASPGGCCDCGDLEAWDRAGCCSAHSGPDLGQDPTDNLPVSMKRPARVVFTEAVRLVTEACLHALQCFNHVEHHPLLVTPPGAATASASSLTSAGAPPVTQPSLLPMATELGVQQQQQQQAQQQQQGGEGLQQPQAQTQAPPPPQRRCVVRLHNDDVHTFNHVTDALLGLQLSEVAAKTFTERVDADGHAQVKWGTPEQLRPALDSLAHDGLLASMVDEAQIEREDRAARLLVWLTHLVTQVDGLARIVAELVAESWPLGLSQLSFSQGTMWFTPLLRVRQPAPDDASLVLSTADASLPLSDPRLSSRLALLMTTDFFLTKRLRAELHALYLHLLADSNFKPALAKALTWVYPVLNGLYSRGVGTHEDSIFSFSVQLYTTASIVRWLSTTTADEERLGAPGLLTVLTEAVLQAMRIAGWKEGHKLPDGFWEHSLLQHRRFSHVLRDLDYSLQTGGTALAMLQQTYPGPGPRPLAAWMTLLGALQHADQVVRKRGAHLEFESTVWTAAFTLSLPLYSTSATLISNGLKPASSSSSSPMQSSSSAPGSPIAGGDSSSAFETGAGGGGEGVVIGGMNGAAAADEEDRMARLRGYTSLMKAAARGLLAWLTCPGQAGNLFRLTMERFEEPGTGHIMVRPAVAFRVHADPVSFHLPLHRFFAAAVMEGTAQGLPPLPGMDVDSPLHFATFLAEFPLRCLSLSAQVSAGLWRRNGISVQGQAIHYATAPFCRVFRDLDLAAVQIALLLAGNEVVLGLLLDRFLVRHWALDPKAVPTEPFEPKEYVALAEEALLLLILLVTELPRPVGGEHRDSVLRRELVHRLACKEGLTHSEVQQVTALAEGESHGPCSAFDTILAGVATRRAGMEAARFDLRPECALEYDGTFYHISRQEHEAAVERVLDMRKTLKQKEERQGKEGGSKPCVGPPPLAHEDFAPVRLLLYWPEMLAFQHTVLRAAAGGPTVFAVLKRSPMLLVRCLHVLHLQLHVYRDALRLEEEACQVEPPSLKAYQQRDDRPVRDFFAALAQPRPAAGERERSRRRKRREGSFSVAGLGRGGGGGGGGGGRGTAVGGAEEQWEGKREDEKEEDEQQLDVQEDEEEEEDDDDDKEGEEEELEGPSILRLLVQLAQDSQGLNVGPLYEEGLQWVLAELADKHLGRFPATAEAEALLQAFGSRGREGSTAAGGKKGKGSAASRAEQAKRAQAKAMSFLKQQQSKFWDEQMEDVQEDEEGGGEGPTAMEEEDMDNPSLEIGAPACLYCHERTGAALGYIGFCQRSNALGNAIEASAQHAGLLQRYRVTHRECLVRVGPELDSPEHARLARGTDLVVEEKRGRRLRISAPVHGWVSEFTADQSRLLEPMKRYCFQQWGRTRLVMTLCGHAVHQDCWDSYYASVLQELISEDRLDGRHALDVNRREFLCPLCKTLSNVLVPHIPPRLRPQAPLLKADEEKGEQQAKTEASVSSLAALAAWTMDKTLEPEEVDESPVSGLQMALREVYRRYQDHCLPEVLVRNMRRFADSLGEVLEVPWSRLGLEGEEGGRGSLGCGPKKLVKALHVGWSAAAHSLLLDVVNRNVTRLMEAAAAEAGGSPGASLNSSGGIGISGGGGVGGGQNEQDRERHLRSFFMAVTGLSALAGDSYYMNLRVLEPLRVLLAGDPLVEDQAQPRPKKPREKAMRALPLALVLDHEVYGPEGAAEGVPFERIRRLHRDRRAAGEPGIVEDWPFFERPLIAHDLSTLAVGAVTLSLHSRGDAIRLAQVLALARLAQALLEPFGGVGGEGGDTTRMQVEVEEEKEDEQMKLRVSEGASLVKLREVLCGAAAADGEDVNPTDIHRAIMSRWRPFLQFLVALTSAVDLQPSAGGALGLEGVDASSTTTAATVPELLVRLGVAGTFLQDGGEVEAVTSMFAAWGKQYHTFNLQVPRLNDDWNTDDVEEEESMDESNAAIPQGSATVPLSAAAEAATTTTAPAPTLPVANPTPTMAEQMAGFMAGTNSILPTFGQPLLQPSLPPPPAQPQPPSPPPDYHATPYLSVLDGSASAPNVDGERTYVPENMAGQRLPLYDISHFGVSDDVALRLIPLPKHYTELYSLLKEQYWSVARGGGSAGSAGSGGGGGGAGGSSSSGIGGGGTGGTIQRGIEDPAICLICGAVLAAGPRTHMRSRLTGPGVCTLHARGCGSGTGIMLLINKGTTLLFRDSRAIFYPSIYVDQYGEEDPNLRRGRPLSLSHTRYERLNQTHRQHGVAKEVASRRMNADRVIRENYY